MNQWTLNRVLNEAFYIQKLHDYKATKDCLLLLKPSESEKKDSMGYFSSLR